MPTALVQALAYQVDAGCLSKPHEIKGKRKIFLFFRKKILFLFIFFVYNADIAGRFRKGFRDHIFQIINIV